MAGAQAQALVGSIIYLHVAPTTGGTHEEPVWAEWPLLTGMAGGGKGILPAWGTWVPRTHKGHAQEVLPQPSTLPEVEQAGPMGDHRAGPGITR